MTIEELTRFIRDIPDFPKPGIVFKDITPLLADALAFRRSVELIGEKVSGYRPEGIVAIESRGFIFGAALSVQLGLPLQLVRKEGKLPHETVGVSYDLEYGTDRVEMHVDAIDEGKSYVVVDDLIATGGTASATAELIERNKGRVACFAFVIELSFLGGAGKLAGRPVETLIRF